MTAARLRILVTAVLAVLLCASAFANGPYSPIGTQKALVILVEFPTTNPCPNPSVPCKVDPTWFASAVGAPRHSPSEWETILNNVATSYWNQTTYNQSHWQYTVLSDPQTADGWWPAPHALNDYFRNTKGGNWYQDSNTPPTYAFVPDVTASVVQSICGNPLLFAVCSILPNYNRLIVMPNFHSFGAQTLGNAYVFGIPTGTSLGNLNVTASAANEGGSDDDLAATIHEMGHQQGELSHYGDCSSVFQFSSFNSIIPAGQIECLNIGWDLMGLSDSFVQLSGYSRVSRGWITPASTASFDLFSGPFSTTVIMNPLEVPPVKGSPNVIRLSQGDLSWPEFSGYFVECRQSIGGDVPTPFPSIPGVGTLADTGVLITNVHEFSLGDIPSAPAHHVERRLSPSDEINTATLQPGDKFTVGVLGLSIRFNGYVGGGVGQGPKQCSVSVANLEPLPPPPSRFVAFAGPVALNGLLQTLQTRSISSDIALNNLIPASAAVANTTPVLPPWVGHHNEVTVRVHDRSPGPLSNVIVSTSALQPAVITNPCGAGPATPNLGSVTLASVPNNASGLGHFFWTPANNGSITLMSSAKGPANTVQTASNFAFQFFHLGNTGGMRTLLTIRQSTHCTMADTYFVGPTLFISGWKVLVQPSQVTLAPGKSATVAVEVIPPASTTGAPGQHAEIPIAVSMEMQMLAPNNPLAINNPNLIAPGKHFMAIGAMTVLARVTAGPGKITLSVPPNGGKVNTAVSVGGDIAPSDPNRPISLEYHSPSGKIISHIVRTNASGAYQDSITPTESGDWTVQSWWSGDATHDPVESPLTTLVILP